MPISGGVLNAELLSRRELLSMTLAIASGTTAVNCVRHRPSRSAVPVGRDQLDRLARSFTSRVLHAGSPGYDEARRVWNRAVERRPLLMARCANVEDVRRCISFAQGRGIPIAVRGGGHSYAGHAVADGVVQVDLAELNDVSVDVAAARATVGGGARIKELLEPTLRAGLYTPMGGCGEVGVAGLTLAGGDTSGMSAYGMRATTCRRAGRYCRRPCSGSWSQFS